jgi:hypothetical protein
MILADILEFLQQRDMASLGEISRHVSAEPEAVRNMLATLQRKGKVHRATPGAGCGSTCQQCATGSLELYAWGPQKTSLPLSPPCGTPPAS